MFKLHENSKTLKTFLTGFVVAAVFSAGAVSAAPIGIGDFLAGDTVIDFDSLSGGGSGLTNGDIVTNQFAGDNIVFSNLYGNSYADDGLGGLAATNSGPNILWSNQGGGSSANQYVQLDFSSAVQRVGMNFFLSRNATFTLALYGAGNTLLESLTLAGAPERNLDEGFAGLSSTSDVLFARIWSTSSSNTSFNFSVDDVRFGGSAIAPVPLPASMLLLGLGLAGLGAVGRRKQKS